MPPPVYRNQIKPTTESSNPPQTTAIPWTHPLQEKEAAVSFDAKIEAMGKQGYRYHSCISLSVTSKLLVFTRV